MRLLGGGFPNATIFFDENRRVRTFRFCLAKEAPDKASLFDSLSDLAASRYQVSVKSRAENDGDFHRWVDV